MPSAAKPWPGPDTPASLHRRPGHRPPRPARVRAALQHRHHRRLAPLWPARPGARLSAGRRGRRPPGGRYRGGGRGWRHLLRLLPGLRAELLPHLLGLRRRRFPARLVARPGPAFFCRLAGARTPWWPDGADALPGRRPGRDRAPGPPPGPLAGAAPGAGPGPRLPSPGRRRPGALRNVAPDPSRRAGALPRLRPLPRGALLELSRALQLDAGHPAGGRRFSAPARAAAAARLCLCADRRDRDQRRRARLVGRLLIRNAAAPRPDAVLRDRARRPGGPPGPAGGPAGGGGADRLEPGAGRELHLRDQGRPGPGLRRVAGRTGPGPALPAEPLRAGSRGSRPHPLARRPHGVPAPSGPEPAARAGGLRRAGALGRSVAAARRLAALTAYLPFRRFR